jgi:hypothetical protein
MIAVEDCRLIFNYIYERESQFPRQNEKSHPSPENPHCEP